MLRYFLTHDFEKKRGNDLAEPRVLDEEISAICSELLGAVPTGITYPGGRDRKTIIANVGDREIVVTKRSSASRGQLEALVLRTLGDSPSVPELLGHKGNFVLQSKLDGQRLSEGLEFADRETRKKLLISAGKSLIELQVKANENGLLTEAPRIGDRKDWHLDFSKAPDRLAEQISVTAPSYDPQALASNISVRLPSFVKWDSRPGNAMVDTKGTVGWFDWEHCGVGSAEDDLVWMLADEWSPNVPEAEFELLKHLAITHETDFEILVPRFHTKAVLHSIIRLGLILRRKGDGPWWNAASSLENDRVGVSPAHVKRVVNRACRWAGAQPHLRSLSDFLRQVNEYAENL